MKEEFCLTPPEIPNVWFGFRKTGEFFKLGASHFQQP